MPLELVLTFKCVKQSWWDSRLGVFLRKLNKWIWFENALIYMERYFMGCFVLYLTKLGIHNFVLFILYCKLEKHLSITIIIHFRNRKQKTRSIRTHMFFCVTHTCSSVWILFHIFFFFCKIDLHHCKNCVVWSYTETFCIFRIGWILILGLQRVLILLLYHLSSLLKWLNILKATLLRGLVMGKLIYLHIVFSTQLFWCHQENCPNPSTLPFSLLLSFSPQFWLKMHYSLLALSY